MDISWLENFLRKWEASILNEITIYPFVIHLNRASCIFCHLLWMLDNCQVIQVASLALRKIGCKPSSHAAADSSSWQAMDQRGTSPLHFPYSIWVTAQITAQKLMTFRTNSSSRRRQPYSVVSSILWQKKKIASDFMSGYTLAPAQALSLGLGGKWVKKRLILPTFRHWAFFRFHSFGEYCKPKSRNVVTQDISARSQRPLWVWHWWFLWS